MTQVEKILQRVFGNLSFQKVENIEAIRRFDAKHSYCLDDQDRIIGVASIESDIEQITLDTPFRHLQYLNLGDNTQFKSLTFAVPMPQLRHLDVSDSALEALQLPMGFEALEWLDVSRNQLKELRLEGAFPALRYLDISDNQIEEFSINAINLKYAYLLKNRLKRLVFQSIAVQLELLDLKNNQLEQLPSNLLGFEGLQALYIHGNPLSSIPQESIPQEEYSNALDDIRNYLSSITEDEAIPNDEVKLILLGNSTAGKSSLLRYLIERKFDESLSSTHGIQNTLWQAEQTDFKINVWDFGGQEFYHATHRLFLSNNAVVIVLFEEATNQQGELPTNIKIYDQNQLVEKRLLLEHFPYTYWLSNLHHFSQKPMPNSTLLVQNKMDIEPTIRVRVSDEEIEKYQLLDRNIQYISVKGKALEERRFSNRFDDFEEDLFEALNSTKAAYKISVKWIEIKEEIRRLSKEKVSISHEEYVSICENIKAGISDSSSEVSVLDTLTNYLHEISVILYYPTISSLKDTVFINPEWITDTIYRILDYEVVQNAGKFDIYHVEEVLTQRQLERDFESQQMIDLMKKFELIFEVKNEPNNYVAAQYLPKNNPEAQTKSCKKIREKCQYHAFTLYYPEFLPKSVMTRFICRYGQLAEDIYWKNGIVFELEGISFWIECMENQKIKVLTEKNDPELINQLFEDFRSINQRNTKVQVSTNEQDYVWVEDLMKHPPQNNQILTVASIWVAVEIFRPIYMTMVRERIMP